MDWWDHDRKGLQDKLKILAKKNPTDEEKTKLYSSKSRIVDLKKLTTEEVMEGRSNAYEFLDMDEFRVIIAGGRDFTNEALLFEKCDNILSNKTNVVIISGGAKGADALGEQYAKEKGYNLEVFKADWEKHGKGAGPMRNIEMAKSAEALIAFWDGESSGTKHMINTAIKAGLKVRTIKYNNPNNLQMKLL